MRENCRIAALIIAIVTPFQQTLLFCEAPTTIPEQEVREEAFSKLLKIVKLI